MAAAAFHLYVAARWCSEERATQKGRLLIARRRRHTTLHYAT